jgi:hypothetical protein
MPSNHYHFSDYGHTYYVTINITTKTIVMITNNGLNSCKHDQTLCCLNFWTSYDNPK